MLKKIISYCILLLLAIPAIAQKTPSSPSCGQKEITDKLFRDNPSLKQFNEQVERSLIQYKRKIQSGELKEARTAAIVTLPVVVHIIHNNGSENITDAQVFQGIQHLNEAFANTGFYDPADGVNTEIQFCLAQRDPNNNPTNGITRDVSTSTVMGGSTYYSDDQLVKNINRWNPTCYINIWLVRSIPGSVAGYAYLPSAHGTNVDGIVQEAAYFGSSFTNDVVGIHEMGHYLGLYHTFEGACSNNDCSVDGDKVCDTPPDQSTASVSCATTMNSCTTDALSGFSADQNDLKEDYMDYGNFNCMKVFTAGQSSRMNWFIQNVRRSLLACKSCLTPCPAPVTADFTVPALPVYAGTNYTFNNSSVNASAYDWYVNGVLQSTATNFNFTFPSIASFTIKLIAKSGNALCNDAEKTVTINTICPVIAGFTKSAAISAAGSPINFTNISIGTTSYEWFVNGVSQSTATNFSYNSTIAGQYIIRLLARNNIANCEKEFIDTVNFTCPVIADFSPVSNTTIINSSITFSSAGAGASSYEWFINGVSSGTGAVFNHTFSTEGSFEIRLVASNGTCASSKIGFVYVTDKCGNANYLYQKGYAQGQNSGGNDIKATADGGSVMAQRIVETGASSFDASILKVDAAGNVQWSNRYSNNAFSNFRKIKPTNDGGYIAIGSIGNPLSRIFIVKTSASGNTLWSRDYSLGNYANGSDILQAADGAFYFVGTVGIPAAVLVNNDVIVGKLDASGNLLWVKNYDARGYEQGNGIAEDNSQLIVCGNKTGTQTSNSGFLLKINKVDGATVWSKSYSALDENFTEVSVHANGYYVNGTKRNSTGIFSDHLFLKTDFSGNSVYARYLRPFGTANGIGVASSYINNAGNIVSQTTEEFGGTFFDFVVVETNPVSGIAWAKKYNRQAWMSAITNSGANGILLTGSSLNFVGQPLQTFVMRLDSAGNAGGCPAENVSPELLPLSFTEAAVDWIGKSIQIYAPPGTYQEIAVTATPNTLCAFTKCDSLPQAPPDCNTKTFQKLIYNPNSQLGFRRTNDMIETSDGNIVITGRMNIADVGGGIDSSFIFKANSAGDIIWSKKQQSTAGLGKITELPNGDYIIAGHTDIDTIVLTRMTKEGNVIWTKKYFDNTQFGDWFSLFHIIKTEDNHLLIWGLTVDGLIMLLKLDFNGQVVWGKNYNFAANSIYTTGFTVGVFRKNLIVEDQDGYAALFPFGGIAALMKVNKGDGSMQWCKEIKFSGNRLQGDQILRTTSGMQIIARAHAGNQDFLADTSFLINLNGTGNLINTFRVIGNRAQDFIESSDHNTIGGGVINNNNSSAHTTLLYEVSGNGQFNWGRKYEVPISFTNSAGGTRLIQTRDKGLLIMTNRRNASNTAWMSALLKTDQTGGSGGCPSEGFTSKIDYPNLSINTIGFAGATDVIYAVKDDIAIFENEDLTVETVCTTTNTCDSLKISGPDSLCSFKDSVTYIAKRSATCHTVPTWKLSDTTFGEIVIVNDSTVRIRFKKNGIVSIKAILPLSCKVLTDSIIVHIIPVKDSIDLGPDIQLCKISTIKLNAGAGFKSYKWNDGSADSTLTAYNPGQYFVEAEDNCGNFYRDTINITQAPDVPFELGPDLTKCDNDTISITAPTGFMKYTWSANYNINNTNLPAVKVWPTKDTSYTVVAQLSTGCIVMDTINVKVFKTIAFTIGNDTSFCEGGSVLLKAAPGFISYLWQDGSSAQTMLASKKGSYEVTATDNNGCKIKDTVSVTVFAPPTVDIGNDPEICKSPDAILNAGNGFSYYLWQDGSVNSKITITQPGKYWVQVTDINNCKGSDTLQITGFKAGPQNFIAPTAELCNGSSLHITAKGIWPKYLWFNNSSNSSTTINAAGKYWLEVTNGEGCTSKESIVVTSKDCLKGIYFPNAFTPNNDSKNDTYKPVSHGILVKYHLTIYNRFGEKVFESTELSKGWDGKYANKKQDTYTFAWFCSYQFQGEPEKMEKGTVTLIR